MINVLRDGYLGMMARLALFVRAFIHPYIYLHVHASSLDITYVGAFANGT